MTKTRKILGTDPKDAQLPRRSGRSNSSHPFATATVSATVLSDPDPDGVEDEVEDDDDEVSEGSKVSHKPGRNPNLAVSDDTDSDEEPESPPRKCEKNKGKPSKSVPNKSLIVTKNNKEGTNTKRPKSKGQKKEPKVARKAPEGANSPLRTEASDAARDKKGRDREENIDNLKGSAAATKKRVAELEAELANIQKQANHKIDKQKAQIAQKNKALYDLQEENHKLAEDVEQIQNYMGKPRPNFDKTAREYQATVKQVKSTVKDSFGEFKFVNTDRQADQYAEYVIDNVGLPYLLHEEDEDAVRRSQVIKDREIFRQEFESIWLSTLNGQRSDAQSALKAVMMEFMKEKKTDQLPEIKWMEYILKRDHSAFEEDDEDDKAAAQKKKDDYAEFLAFYDFYVDRMLPTAAGPKKWNVQARHFQPLSTSKLPDGRLRVHPSSEAVVALFFANNHKKWMTMKKWADENPGQTNKNRWIKTKPNENKDYATLYSDASAGQNKFGGWTKEGRKLYGRYGLMVKTARKENKDVGLQYETECFKRLYEANKEMHEKKKKTKKRKYEAEDEEDEEDEELDWV